MISYTDNIFFNKAIFMAPIIQITYLTFSFRSLSIIIVFSTKCLWAETRERISIVLPAGKEGRKEGNALYNDALITFYLRLYGVRHMVKDHSGSERGNPLPPHGLLFPISS